MTERRAGKYLADVARIGNTSPYALYQAKTLQPIAAAFILPEVKDESKWWSGKHQYVDAEGKYIFVPVGSVSVNMVALQYASWCAPAELSSFWDLLNEKWRAQDRRHRSARRRLRPERCAHGLLSSATGRRVFAPAIYRTSRDDIAGLPPSDRLGGAAALFDPAIRQRRRCPAGQSAGFADQRLRYRFLERRRRVGTGRVHIGLAGSIAASQCGESFHQLAALARWANGGSARRRR